MKNEPFLARLSHLFANRRYVNYWIVYAVDVFLSCLCSFLMLVFVDHFIYDIPARFFGTIIAYSGLVSAIVYYLLRIHHNIIRHATIVSLGKIAGAVILRGLVLIGIALLMDDRIPFRIYFIMLGIDFLLTCFVLVGFRIALVVFYEVVIVQYTSRKLRVLVYGVNDRSISLGKSLQTSKHYALVGFINPQPEFMSYNISTKPVLHFADDFNFGRFVNKYNINGVIFSDNKDAQAESDKIVAYCQNHQIRTLLSPPIDKLGGGLKRSMVQDIKIEDLLGRDEIKINMDEIIRNFSGKTIMVTGAAGSIGSELCRQLATFGIKHLVLYDNAETPMHEIRLELERRFPDLSFSPFIGDVRQEPRLRMAFERFKPQVVFHAAAYKHVPLMEENPCEAVLVNVYGSRMVADLCVEYGVEKMVMISTDKAVNPTNVMGASKRLAEIYVQSLGLAMERGEIQGKTKFVTTRFGNVLGSNGSVIPYFRKQIERGGPVTVTHPDITRFFMTIPEACRLVMEAATMSTGNQIFVFDMGKSVKIADLADRMIRLAGYKPNEDIKIVFTGLRPGEKLYEEVLSNEENTMPTDHEKIRIAKVREYNRNDVLDAYEELRKLSVAVRIDDTVKLMKQIVPEFKSNNSIYEKFDVKESK